MNLAHGELMMLSSYFLLVVVNGVSSHPVLTFFMAIGMSGLVGILVYIFLMRRMTGEMVLAAILTTIAIGILIRGVVVLVWSAQQQYPAVALGIKNQSIPILPGATISLFALALVVATLLVYGALFAFLKFGRWGLRMRATGQDPLLAAQRGINLHAVYALAWGLSTMTGGLAGMLIALDSSLDSTMPMIGLKAFPAALVGGLDSFAGALVGALIVSAAEILMIHYVDPLLSEVVPFVVLIAMLIVRPWGLFGTREELDRV